MEFFIESPDGSDDGRQTVRRAAELRPLLLPLTATLNNTHMHRARTAQERVNRYGRALELVEPWNASNTPRAQRNSNGSRKEQIRVRTRTVRTVQVLYARTTKSADFLL